MSTTEKRIALKAAHIYGLWGPVEKTWTRKRSNASALCDRGLRRLVAIPPATKELDVVFTKTRRAHSLTLVDRGLKVRAWGDGERYTVTQAPKTGLYEPATRAIAAALREGYKYVHFEY